jgi:hypothetical protein
MKKLAAVDIGTSFGSPFGQSLGVGNLVSIILSNAVVLAGVIMLFLMLIGGFGIIMGAGQDNPETAAKGRKAVTAAVIGFIIIFASYWIIKIVETITAVKILKPGL